LKIVAAQPSLQESDSTIRTINVGSKVRFEIFVKRLPTNINAREIPTTFLALSPDKIQFEQGRADLLFGVFHMKWSDMPKPSTYAIKISDPVVSDGTYVGTQLECKYPKELVIFLHD
jgi:hypothetical protein